MSPLSASDWLPDLLLRGAVGGVLLFHVIHLALPGPRAAARAALALLALSLLGYLLCQRAELLALVPRPLAWAALALAVGVTAWLWLAARSLFDDRFAMTAPRVGAALGLVVLGLSGSVPRLGAWLDGLPDPGPSPLSHLHAAAMLAFTAAALWEVARGWRDDLVEPRRAVRRWVVLGIGLYASVALVVELALRGRTVGPLLPALHVLGIGAIAMALAVLIARRSPGVVFGEPAPDPDTAERIDAPPAQPPGPVQSPALALLTSAMSERRLYRREGLTLSALAAELGMGEAALRGLINQQMGYRNFNDFLHHYRLQEAADRLTREDLPILSIALECGYGSIGPFNRAFRQRHGMTPTEYRAGARLQRLRQAT